MDVFFLISNQAAVGGVSDSDLEMKAALFIQITVGEFLDGDELIVPPAFPDVELGGVLSDGGFFGKEVVDQLDFVLILIFVFVALGKLEKD